MTPKKLGNLVLALVVLMMILAACVRPDETATPTPITVEGISTSVAATVFAGQTNTAIAQPTMTPSPTSTVTPTGTVTPTLAATRAVYVPVQPVYTVVITTTGTPGTLMPTVTGTYGAVGGKNSALAQDFAVPNMKAGETFTKSWLIKNTGSVVWTSGYKITYVGGELLGRDYSTKIFTTVSPGGTYTQNLKFTAPSSPGTYTGTWRLADESGNLFGVAFIVTVTVPGATNTPTPTTSASLNATATAAAATANARASATAKANATNNASAVQTAVAATQTQSAANGAANAAATQTAAAAQTQAAIDAANAAATSAAAAQTQAVIDAANAAATQAAIDAAATQSAAASQTAAAQPPTGP